MKTILFNPFNKYTDRTLLTIGIVVTILGSLLGYWMNTRFDGFIDIEPVKNIVLYTPFLDNLINIFSCCLILYPLGKILNKKTRLFDILVISMISRIPIYLMALLNINGFMTKNLKEMLGGMPQQPAGLQQINLQELLEATMNNIGFLALFTIVFVLINIWQVAILYNGFKLATHSKGTSRSILLFIVGVIGMIIVSKILIYLIY